MKDIVILDHIDGVIVEKNNDNNNNDHDGNYEDGNNDYDDHDDGRIS